MFKTLKQLYRDENGNYFVEIGLALIVLTLAIVTSASDVVQDGIVPKYNDVNTELQGVTVPDLTP